MLLLLYGRVANASSVVVADVVFALLLQQQQQHHHHAPCVYFTVLSNFCEKWGGIKVFAIAPNFCKKNDKNGRISFSEVYYPFYRSSANQNEDTFSCEKYG